MKIRKSELKKIIREVIAEARGANLKISPAMKHILKKLPPMYSDDENISMVVGAIELIAAKQKQENLTFDQAFKAWEQGGGVMGSKGRKKLYDAIKKSGDAFRNVVSHQ